jgi:hypothetical protein
MDTMVSMSRCGIGWGGGRGACRCRCKGSIVGAEGGATAAAGGHEGPHTCRQVHKHVKMSQCIMPYAVTSGATSAADHRMTTRKPPVRHSFAHICLMMSHASQGCHACNRRGFEAAGCSGCTGSAAGAGSCASTGHRCQPGDSCSECRAAGALRLLPDARCSIMP